MTTTIDTASLLASIRDQRATKPLSIITLAEPLLTDQHEFQQQRHQSTNSSDSISPSRSTSNKNTTTNGSHPTTTDTTSTALSPSILQSDLTHYRDLFSKLRFSYLEQVTKEKYLRSIVGDPPILVTADENIQLEQKLVGMKADLKAKKVQTDELVSALEVLAEQVAEKYDFVSEGLEGVEALMGDVEGLEEEVGRLRRELEEKEKEVEMLLDDDNNDKDDGEEMGGYGEDDALLKNRMNMSLADTMVAIEDRERGISDVDAEIAALQAQLQGKTSECEKVERELGELEMRKNEVTRLARDVVRRREEGGMDPLEEKGRWLRGQETVLRGLLGISA